jgi:hypothetical protein
MHGLSVGSHEGREPMQGLCVFEVEEVSFLAEFVMYGVSDECSGYL